MRVKVRLTILSPGTIFTGGRRSDLTDVPMSSEGLLMHKCNSFRRGRLRLKANTSPSGAITWLGLIWIWLAFAATAHAAPCPRPATLGTSRILTVDVAT